tara:strand:+ start:1808 stop:2416 length:609 start_codon:yes stop_codon:yes gene_type:complete
MKKKEIKIVAQNYLDDLFNSFDDEVFEKIEILSSLLLSAWENNRKIFICGNGGSGANSIHIANDFLYGVGATGEGPILPGLSIESLVANQAVITCLSNDIGYENIFSYQLKVKASKNDILIVLSGSGNSKNILNAIKFANANNIYSFALLAFDGGECKNVINDYIQINENNMELAEDSQMIIFNICKKYLSSIKSKISIKNK